MTTTTINTGSYLLDILQAEYNHHQSLADSYAKMTELKKTDTKFAKIEKEHKEKASDIFGQVVRLGLMDKEVDYVGELLKAYRIFSVKKKIEEGEA